MADDPLVNTNQCQLDAALMKELGANAIRVYHVDPLADHAGCMQVFADVGIYLFVDLDTFQTYIKLVRLQGPLPSKVSSKGEGRTSLPGIRTSQNLSSK